MKIITLLIAAILIDLISLSQPTPNAVNLSTFRNIPGLAGACQIKILQFFPKYSGIDWLFSELQKNKHFNVKRR